MGIFHKGEHKKVFDDTENIACGSNNYMLGFEVTNGNLHNTVFPLLYNNIKTQYEAIENVIVDV